MSGMVNVNCAGVDPEFRHAWVEETRRSLRLRNVQPFGCKSLKPILTKTKTGAWKNANRHMHLKAFFPRLRTLQK
jgi:hypothetical protein